MSVAPDQKHTRWHPCRVCGGWDAMRRGRGIRCNGYDSEDEAWIFCENVEHAGSAPRYVSTVTPTYRHRADGCSCGVPHMDEGAPPPRPRDTAPASDTAPARKPTRTHLRHTPIAIHEYRDADGSIRFRVARFWSRKAPPDREGCPKCLPQIPDGAGDWIDGLGGMPYGVLYQLPELLSARPRRPVFLPEGEACVDALTALGLVAACNAGGANKWESEYSAHLRGRHVVILLDNDSAGRESAEKIATDLRGIAASVCVLELPGLPEHGDVRDWLADGHTALELLELAYDTLATSAPTVGVAEPSEPIPINRRDALAVAQETIDHYRQREAIERKVFADRHMHASEKLVYMAVYDRQVRKSPKDLQQQHRYVAETTATRVGLSADQVRDAWKKGKERGIYHKNKVDGPDESTGLFRSHIMLAPTSLENLDNILPLPTDGRGGKRVKKPVKVCPECGSEHLEAMILCHACGTASDRHPVNEPEPEQEDPGTAPADGPDRQLAHLEISTDTDMDTWATCLSGESETDDAPVAKITPMETWEDRRRRELIERGRTPGQADAIVALEARRELAQ